MPKRSAGMVRMMSKGKRMAAPSAKPWHPALEKRGT
jgi:hypothetical protein